MKNFTGAIRAICRGLTFTLSTIAIIHDQGISPYRRALLYFLIGACAAFGWIAE